MPARSGTFVDADGKQHGFVRGAAGLRTIEHPGGGEHLAGDLGVRTGLGTAVGTIRDDGASVGAWGDAAGAEHGFLRAPGRRRLDRDAPGASTAMDPLFQTFGGTVAIRANLRGDVVGSFAPARRTTLSPVDRRAFIRRGTTWRTLLPPGAATSQAFGLDERGTVGGVAFDPVGLTGYGWIRRAGRFTRIDPAPPLVLTSAAATAAGP